MPTRNSQIGWAFGVSGCLGETSSATVHSVIWFGLTRRSMRTTCLLRSGVGKRSGVVPSPSPLPHVSAGSLV
ncbi:MAG TPA: hypothetical protein VEO01_11755, partial [Pseudonocardiaceae bacterium]|nr:hypothetical protein [Pseudonocardiaceae bacterium]